MVRRRSPASSRSWPAAAIIAALSVQRRREGTASCQPRSAHSARERLAERGVRGHAAGEHHAVDAEVARRPHGLAHQHLHHRRLEGGGDIGHLARGRAGPPRAHVKRHRRLDAAEREVRCAVAHLRGGECDRARASPVAGDALDGGAARVSEPEELGDLVEGLARGVVARLADALVAPAARARRTARCGRPTRPARGTGSSAGSPRGTRRRRGPRGGSRRRAAGGGHRRCALATEQPTSSEPTSPGPWVTAMPSSSPSPSPRRRAPAATDRHDDLEMPPRRQLGDDAAVRRVDVVLRGHDARQHLAAAVEHRGGRLVAGGLDAEDDHARAIIGDMGEPASRQPGALATQLARSGRRAPCSRSPADRAARPFERPGVSASQLFCACGPAGPGRLLSMIFIALSRSSARWSWASRFSAPADCRRPAGARCFGALPRPARRRLRAARR